MIFFVVSSMYYSEQHPVLCAASQAIQTCIRHLYSRPVAIIRGGCAFGADVPKTSAFGSAFSRP